MKSVKALVDLFPHLDPEELVQHGPVESFDESIGLRMPYTGPAVLDIVQLEVELIRMLFGTTELSAVVGQDILDTQLVFLVERQDIIMQHGNSCLSLLGNMQRKLRDVSD